MKLLRHIFALALLIGGLSVQGQVVRLAGGLSSTTSGEGASATMYQGDTTSQVGIGFAEGFHLSASREARFGNSSLTVGDTSMALHLPTDLEDAPRQLNARGLTLRTADAAKQSEAFIGVTGDGASNAYFSSVTSVHPLAIFASTRKVGAVEVSGLEIMGERSNSLASVAFRPSQATLVAMTTGLSAGAPVFRMAAHHGDGEEHLDLSYTAGRLQLQPQTDLINVNLERVGWNLSGGKHIGRWLYLDGARQEYDTADAAKDPMWQGVTANRSTMLEGAASLQFGRLQNTYRIFGATSGAQRTTGQAFSSFWHSRLWDARITTVKNDTTGAALPNSPGTVMRNASTTTFVEGSQQVARRFVVRESATLAGSTRGLEFGGAYDGDRFGVSVGHREIFVPFGTNSGFRRLLVFGFRIRLHDSQVQLDTTRGGGLPSTYSLTTEGYYGQMQGEQFESGRMPRMPKFQVRGRVLNEAGKPLRGAAVAVGNQVVYTDSDGQFLARMDRKAPVAVALRPADFLTAQTYAAVSQPVTTMPTSTDEVKPVELSASLSHTVAAEASPVAEDLVDNDEQQAKRSRIPQFVKELFRRMLFLHGHGQAARA